jgi:hypothetical protein
MRFEDWFTPFDDDRRLAPYAMPHDPDTRQHP